MRYILIFVLLFITCSGFTENLQDSTKHGYHLFSPTPESQMRSFETDRPDLTESAYTVDAGHFQFETDVFKTERTTEEGITSIQNLYNVFNLKLGITNTLDIQLITEMLVHSKINKSGPKTSAFFSNITIRAKQNIYGNDSGKSAMAILPFINFSANSEEKITGGLVVPFSLALQKVGDLEHK